MIGQARINTAVSLGAASLSQIAATQAGYLINPSCSVHTDQRFIMPNTEFVSMTEGSPAFGVAKSFSNSGGRAYRSSLARFMATTSILTCMGCAPSTHVPPNVGHTSYPKTNISSHTGISFQAGKPLRRYRDGVIISGISADDITVGGFTIKANSEIWLNRDGRVVSAIPNQEIKIPVAPLKKEFEDSIFEGFISSYRLKVTLGGNLIDMQIRDIVDIILARGGILTIPAGSIRMFFDEDGEIDEVESLIDELRISCVLSLVVKGARINIFEKLSPYFPQS